MLRIVSVYQLLHICMAPGIEPGNLIRSTLIRYPPGPFLLKQGYMDDITKLSLKYSNNITGVA